MLMFMYGERKSKAVVPSTTSVAELKAIAEADFSLLGVTLQHFDTDFEEWVEIKQGDYVLPKKGKIKVAVYNQNGSLKEVRENYATFLLN